MPAPYQKVSRKQRSSYVINTEPNNEKGIFDRVTNMIVPSWISGWWSPTETANLKSVVHVSGERKSSDSEEDQSNEPTANGHLGMQKPTIMGKQKFVTHTRMIPNYIQIETTGTSSISTSTQPILNTATEKPSTSTKIQSRPVIRKYSHEQVPAVIKNVHSERKRKMVDDEAETRDTYEPNVSKQTFYDSFRRSHVPTASNKPAFNVSAFVSPKIQTPAYQFHNTSLNTTSFDFTSAQSPFYSGSTMYGGSSSIRESANKRAKVSPVSNRLRTTRTHVKAKPLPSAKRNMVTSNTAKRILNTLGQMSTPLRDARSLPKASFHGPSFSEMIKTNQKNKDTEGRPPTKKMNTSKPTEIATNFQNKFNMMKRFNAKNVVTTSTQESAVSSVDNSTSKKNTMKVRREKTSMHYSSVHENVEVVNTMPEVTQISVPLMVTSLPKISFSAIKPTVKQELTTIPSVTPIFTKKTTKLTVTNNIETGDANEFLFASPDVLNNKNPSHMDTGIDFTFKSPVILSNDKTKSPNLHSTSPIRKMSPPPQAQKPKIFQQKRPEGSWACPTCMIDNKKEAMKCVSCSDHKPGKHITLQTEKLSENTTSQPFKKLLKMKVPPEGTWSCSMCMIDNDKTALKCVACSTDKPGIKISAIPATNPISSNTLFSTSNKLKLKFGQPEDGSWSCPVCMIDNKKESQKCTACSAPNPLNTGKESDTTAIKKVVEVKPLKMKFTQNTDNTWECPSCMINNNNETLKCKACSESKPGVQNQPSSLTPTTGFTFGTSSSSSLLSSSSSSFAFPTTNITGNSGLLFKTQNPTVQSTLSFNSTNKNDTVIENKGTSGSFSFAGAEKKESKTPFSFTTGTEQFPSSQADVNTSISTNTKSSASTFSFSKPANNPTGFSFLAQSATSSSIEANFQQPSSVSTEPAEKTTFPSIAYAAKAGFLKVTEMKPESNASAGFQFGVKNTDTNPSIIGSNKASTAPSFSFGTKQELTQSNATTTSQFGTSTSTTATLNLPAIDVVPVSNVSFNFGAKPAASSAPLFGQNPSTVLPPSNSIASNNQSVFGTANRSFGGGAAGFNFGTSAATLNFGSPASLPTFETKTGAFDLSSSHTSNQTTPQIQQDSNTKPNTGFSFSAGAAPSFNFGSNNNNGSYTMQPNNVAGSLFAPPTTNTTSNLFSMGAGNSVNPGKFDAMNGPTRGQGRKPFRKAARRIKK